MSKNEEQYQMVELPEWLQKLWEITPMLAREAENDYINLKKQLALCNVVGRSEELKAEVFTLANKLAVAGEGDVAVAMHRIHNHL